ncbi:MAG: NUDIX hydrolase [Bacteroidetes bacterium]|nr:NUDIX hydrolase [Bacteroidota bacterium]
MKTADKEALKRKTNAKISRPEFFNIAISVDCVIFGYAKKELQVLLIKSNRKEFSELYSLPGDLVRPDEDLDTAPYRVLKEKTGMDDVFLEQVQAFGAIDRHPSGRVITIAYYSLIDILHHKLQLSDNDLHWHSVKNINQLAFDHKLILDTCIHKLKEQIMDHPLVFNLLPEKFSLRELQDVYEAIINITLDRRNFRKMISLKKWLLDLNELEINTPRRPGKLYKLKKEYSSFNGQKKK